MTFLGLNRPIAHYITSWHTSIGYQGRSRYVFASLEYVLQPHIGPIIIIIIGANIIKNLSFTIQKLKCSMMLASLVGLVGAVECTVGTHKRCL